MAAQTIYMMNGRGADPAILKGLTAAGCEVRDTHSVAETLNSLRAADSHHGGLKNLLLVAEVQAGAIPLLTLLKETGTPFPPTLLFDQDGNSIQSAIKALTLGVQEYILASEPAVQRELRARVMAERIQSKEARKTDKPVTTLNRFALPRTLETADSAADFQWDPDANVIYMQDKYIRLSPVEGRIFDLLLSRRNHTVDMDDLINHGLLHEGANIEAGIKLLRPHMMRLRNKLERYAGLAHRIVNVRGNGYMFI